MRYNCACMYTPSREEFVAAAARGNLIPVYRELLADGDTPVSAYAELGARRALVPARVASSAARSGRRTASSASRRARSCTWRGRHARRHLVRRRRRRPAAHGASGPTADPTAALAEVLGELRPVDVPGPAALLGRRGRLARLRQRARFERAAARAKPDELGLPALCLVITDTLRDLRQPAPDASRSSRRRTSARPERRRGARTTTPARASRRSSTKLRAPAPPLRPLEPPRVGERAAPNAAVVTRRRLRGRRATASRSTSSPATSSRSCCSQRFSSRAARRRRPVRRLPRAARDQPVAVHVPPRVPRGARSPAPRPRCWCGSTDGEVEVRPIAGTRRAARTAERGRARSRPSCSPIRRSAPSTSCWSTSAATTSGASRESARVDVDRADGDRALLARHAPGLATCAASCAPGIDRARRAARRVPGRHADRRAEDPRDGDHRRARADAARHLRRRRRLHLATRATWTSRSRSARCVDQGRHDLRAGRRRHRRRQRSRSRVRGVRQQGARGACAPSRWRGAPPEGEPDAARDRQLRLVHLQPRPVPGRAGRGGARRAQRRDHRRRRSRRCAPDAHRDLAGPVHAERGRHLAGRDPTLRRARSRSSASASATRRSARRSAATIVRAARVMHGKTSQIHHDGKGVFAGLPEPVRGDALPLAA